jgi:DNA polymerase-4
MSILHVDMDAFFAAVEQHDNPTLRGKPVLVGGRPQSRGVVAAASYEARAFGVHSAMPTATAQRLCPHAVLLPVRIQRYAQVTYQLREIFLSFTPLVELVSLDEAYLDVRACPGPAVEVARLLKQRVREETGLTASVGVAANKFLAKLAGDLGKPDGLLVIEPGQERALLDPLPVARLWGVGPRTEARLHELGLKTVGQVAALPERVLADHLGEPGRSIWRLAHGRDDRPVEPEAEARSISTETTFPRDVSSRAVLRACLLHLVEQLGQRLRRLRASARTIELKVRTAEFRTHSRSLTLPEPTDVTAVLWQTARGLLERLPEDWLPLRLLGVGASGLVRDAPVQGQLFDGGWHARQRALDQAVDAIRRRFGDGSIRRLPGES